MYTPAMKPRPTCEPELSANTGPAIVSSPWFVTVPDNRPACRNGVVTHVPRSSNDTSDAPSCDEARRVRERGRRIVGEAGEGAADGEALRSWVEEVELQRDLQAALRGGIGGRERHEAREHERRRARQPRRCRVSSLSFHQGFSPSILSTRGETYRRSSANCAGLPARASNCFAPSTSALLP